MSAHAYSTTLPPLGSIRLCEAHALARPRRFTRDGSAALEAHLERTCERVQAGVCGLIPADQLEALILGGGYGRGEGGVLRTSTADQPYNDLDFFVAVRGKRRWNEARYAKPLAVLGELMTPQAGVHVEFKVISLSEWQHQPISMFSYDLVMGHRWLVGDESLLARCGHHRLAETIPASEATRLLMNRCTGLLLARERLERTPFTQADSDFVRRNIAKAELALGDAIVTARGRYHWSCRERQRRLQPFLALEHWNWMGEVLAHHAAGVEFKLHPEDAPLDPAALRQLHAQVTALALSVWLELESRRLGTRFGSVRDYAAGRGKLCAESGWVRHTLLNLARFGRRALRGRLAVRHPRERILRTLALLLWDPPQNAAGWRQIQQFLAAPPTSVPAELLVRYEHGWRTSQ